MARQPPGSPDEITPLEALLGLTQSAAGDPVPEVLRFVAQTVRGIAGFGSVVLNVFRPEWDDYRVELVLGSEETRAEMEGATTPRGPLEELLARHEPLLPGTYLITADSGFWDAFENTYSTPLGPTTEGPDAWQEGDGLLVFLTDTARAPLGFLSMDAPFTGRRPTEEELRLIRAVSLHAEQALESAQRTTRTLENERIHSKLLEASPALAASASLDDLLRTACDTVVPDLGFQRIAAYLVDEHDLLVLAHCSGWEDHAGLTDSLHPQVVQRVLAPDLEHAGCWLIDASELFPAPARQTRSLRNGRGPSAWYENALVLPSYVADGRLRALFVIEDPIDRLLPTDARRRALRLLVDQLSAVQSTIDYRNLLQHLATHDPLTGVRNRRDLTELISEHANVALLVCDLDHFKRVNDRYGHEVGDTVLARFGELLRELARETDVPVRLGGEEFCMILPHTDHAGAVAAAERLRVETARPMRELVPEGITVSVGVAVTSRGVLDARGLLAAADRGLYAAKQAGRDRSVSG
jgi:diguanylate cyclase (GGDEF)-like protein